MLVEDNLYATVEQDALDDYRHRPWDCGEHQREWEQPDEAKRPAPTYRGDWRGSVVDDCPEDPPERAE